MNQSGLPGGITRRLGGLIGVVVLGMVALRWALDVLTSARYFPLFVAVVVALVVWRLVRFFRHRL